MTVNLEAVRQAVQAERNRAISIIEWCGLAGKPAMAADLIAEGLNVDSVRRRLESLTPVEPVTQRPSAGNGSGAFDIAMIERELAAGRVRQ